MSEAKPLTDAEIASFRKAILTRQHGPEHADARLLATIDSLAQKLETYNNFLRAIEGIMPHATRPDMHIEALLDKVKENTTLRADVAVLAAECKAARAWHDTETTGTGMMMELSTNWDNARATTDQRFPNGLPKGPP